MPKSASSSPAVEPTPTDVKPVVQDSDQTGVLFSRLDYPVTIPYGATTLRLSPHGRTEQLLRSHLTSRLPDGVTFVPSNI